MSFYYSLRLSTYSLKSKIKVHNYVATLYIFQSSSSLVVISNALWLDPHLDSQTMIHTASQSISCLFFKTTKSQLQICLRDLLSARFIRVMIAIVQFPSKRHHCHLQTCSLLSRQVHSRRLVVSSTTVRNTRSESYFLLLHQRTRR